ncbi:MAG TPA: NAD(P)-dependent oxidoreductase [Thermoleophilaceae bacterium]
MARRVLVAGATGQIGELLTPALVAVGDEVYGLARSENSAEKVRELGATPVMGDALDRDAVMAAVAEAKPEVIVHQLTAIPRGGINPRKMDEAFGPTTRLRREATRHLVEAAEQHGVRRLVAQSIAFAYRHEGPEVLDESAPLDTDAPGLADIVGGVAALEEAVLGSSAVEGVVLRYGMFYGPDSAYSPNGSYGEMVTKRRLPIIGDGNGRQSFIQIDDAVSATLAAIDRGSGVYNVVDDEPARAREWVPGLAEALGAKPPRHAPAWLARLAAGPAAVRVMTTQRGASNARIKQELGWEPRYTDWRSGFPTLTA